MHLTVVQAFGEYVKGDKILEHDDIIEILGGENASNVVKTADPGDPVNGTKLN